MYDKNSEYEICKLKVDADAKHEMGMLHIRIPVGKLVVSLLCVVLSIL
jgi:hypothetical protein